MTEKSAIQKMVEWLESRLAKPENVVAGVLLELVKTKARRLAAEEKAKPVEATAEASLGEKCNNLAVDNTLKHTIVTQNVINLRELHEAKISAYLKAQGKANNSAEFLAFCKASEEYNSAVRQDPFGAYLIELIAYKKKRNGCYVILTDVLKEYENSRPAPTAVEELVRELRGLEEKVNKDYVVAAETGDVLRAMRRFEQGLLSVRESLPIILAKYNNAKGGK